eukprot:5138243-Prymnesium_polylepis.1
MAAQEQTEREVRAPATTPACTRHSLRAHPPRPRGGTSARTSRSATRVARTSATCRAAHTAAGAAAQAAAHRDQAPLGRAAHDQARGAAGRVAGLVRRERRAQGGRLHGGDAAAGAQDPAARGAAEGRAGGRAQGKGEEVRRIWFQWGRGGVQLKFCVPWRSGCAPAARRLLRQCDERRVRLSLHVGLEVDVRADGARPPHGAARACAPDGTLPCCMLTIRRCDAK